MYAEKNMYVQINHVISEDIARKHGEEINRVARRGKFHGVKIMRMQQEKLLQIKNNQGGTAQ